MKKTRITIFLMLLSAMVLLLAACGGEPEETAGMGSMEETVLPQDDPNEGLGGDLNEDTVNDFSGFEGIWLGDSDNDYDYLEIDAEGNWMLYLGGDVIADGYLQYEPEWESIYAYNYQDGSGGRFALEDSGRLYISTYGYFHYGDGMEYIWYDDGGGDHDGDQPENDYRLTEDDESYPNDGGNEFYSWNSELYQRNVSEFEGVWYYDGDLSAETYIVIDGDGNWSYYQRAPGEAEAEEMDCGIFTYSTDEASTYYADSTMYDGVSIRVFEFDDDVLVWGDEGVYYLME